MKAGPTPETPAARGPGDVKSVPGTGSTEHELKTWARYWDAIADGRKTFEVRKNDRAFQTGDILVLMKTDELGRYVYESRAIGAERVKLRKRITYLLQGGQFGIEPGFCVLGLGEP